MEIKEIYAEINIFGKKIIRFNKYKWKHAHEFFIHININFYC